MGRNRWFPVALAMGLGMVAALLAVAEIGLAEPLGAPAAPASGPRFPIAAGPNDEHRAAVAYDEGRDRYLVVFENDSGVLNAMNAVCISSMGVMTTYVVGSGPAPQNPDVVYSPDHDKYLVVYDTGAGDVGGQFISGMCCIQVGCAGAPFTISGDRPGFEFDPSVAYNQHGSHQEYLVAWADDNATSDYWGIWARRVLSFTQTPSPSFMITGTASAWNYEPDVAYNLNRNEYLVVYTNDPSQGLTQTERNVYGRLVKNTGGVAPLAEHAIDATSNSQDSPSVAAYRLNYSTPYLVAYRDHWNDPAGDVRAYLVFTDGLPSTLLNISTDYLIQEAEPDVASNEALGGFTVVWSWDAGGYWDVYWRQLDGSGDFLIPALHVAAVGGRDEMGPAVAGGLPSAMAVWQEWNGRDWDIYGRLLSYEQVFLPLVLRGFQ